MREIQKLSLLSKNIIEIFMKLLENQNFCKLVYYRDNEPLINTNASVELSDLMLVNLLPYPFDTEVETESGIHVHVYYYTGKFKNKEIIEDNTIFFDVICSKDLWLITENGQSVVRPYRIIEEIANTFNTFSVSTLGRLEFDEFIHIAVNNKFDCIRLVANNFNIAIG